MSGFSFHAQDFAYAFLSILFEGMPFVLLGTLLSGIIDAFLPGHVMTRFLPRNRAGAIAVSGLLGLVLPMCECGIVPVIRRLIRKGLPVSCGIAYMLAAPILNPVVALSTFAAFRGQSPEAMTVLRLALGYLAAVLAAFAVHAFAGDRILRPGVLAVGGAGSAVNARRRTDFQIPGSGEGAADPAPTVGNRWAHAVRVAVTDFLDVAVYLVIGAALASLFNTSVDQERILPLAGNPPAATAAMMGLAAILSLCSTSDAFIAATFTAFPAASKLAFLVFGPMFDCKLLFLYAAVFRRRFVLVLGAGLFAVVWFLATMAGKALP
jgi:uncharacterized membrane protein YraQ (UPF0718 family)